MQPSSQQPITPNRPQATYPGKGLGIAGFVLSLLVSGVGLILSIIAFVQSRKAGFKNNLALAGIIVGSILTVFGLVIATIGIIFAISISNQCQNLGSGTHDVNGTTITCGSDGTSYNND